MILLDLDLQVCQFENWQLKFQEPLHLIEIDTETRGLVKDSYGGSNPQRYRASGLLAAHPAFWIWVNSKCEKGNIEKKHLLTH